MSYTVQPNLTVHLFMITSVCRLCSLKEVKTTLLHNYDLMELSLYFKHVEFLSQVPVIYKLVKLHTS